MCCAFKKCGISHTLTGTDDYLWEEFSNKELPEDSTTEDDNDWSMKSDVNKYFRWICLTHNILCGWNFLIAIANSCLVLYVALHYLCAFMVLIVIHSTCTFCISSENCYLFFFFLTVPARYTLFLWNFHQPQIIIPSMSPQWLNRMAITLMRSGLYLYRCHMAHFWSWSSLIQIKFFGHVGCFEQAEGGSQLWSRISIQFGIDSDRKWLSDIDIKVL